MKTAYDKLIEESIIEEDYGTEFNKKTWKKMEKLVSGLTKEFNLMRT
jgi:hypothetical protein